MECKALILSSPIWARKRWTFLKLVASSISPFQNYPATSPEHVKRLDGSLPGGESYVVMNVYEELTESGGYIHRTEMLPLADLVVYTMETNVAGDSVSPFYYVARL